MRDELPGFGKALRARREVAGLTLQWLSEAAGTHFTTISQIENGKRSVSLRVAAQLAAALDVSLDDLLRDAAVIAASESPSPS